MISIYSNSLRIAVLYNLLEHHQHIQDIVIFFQPCEPKFYHNIFATVKVDYEPMPHKSVWQVGVCLYNGIRDKVGLFANVANLFLLYRSNAEGFRVMELIEACTIYHNCLLNTLSRRKKI